MEYTVEEVQPLDDDNPQSAEEVDPNSNIPLDNNPQLSEEIVSSSTSPEDSLPQPAAEVESMPASPDDSLPQPTAEIESIPASPEESTPQPTEEIESIPASPENSTPPPTAQIEPIPASPEENIAQPASETGLVPPLPEEINLPAVNETVSIPAISEIADQANTKKIALILSGGGARGAFQVGAEKYARDVKGYHWDIIAGVSVGAMNGAMLAMHRYTRLMELWDSISDSQIYTGGFNLVSLVKLMFGAKSFYGNAPLQKLMQHEFEAGRIIDDLHVGAVSLISGEYVQFTKESLELARAILASASIPVVWPPVDVSPDRSAMVDGGVRNITPVGDVLDLEPDEIVIINCSAEQPSVLPNASENVLSIGMRALDIMQNEIFVDDMKEFLCINALVKEAEQQNCFLHNPKTGKLLKYYPCQIIEPDCELGVVLDFSQTSIQKALKTGVRRAREVLGRP